MTDSSAESPRYSGQHRRTQSIFDTYGLFRAAATLPSIAARVSQHSLTFVRTALSYRPEHHVLRRGIAGIGAAAVLSLSIMGASPATSYAEAPGKDSSTSAQEQSKTKVKDDHPRPNAAPEAKPEANNPERPKSNNPDKKAPPRPVAGLNATQMGNAVKVVRIGHKLNVSKKGQAVALVTAMQETKMENLASTAVPESQNYDNDGLGSDHDSVGLFQQRPSMGWGSVEECMDVNYSTSTFYKKLKSIDNWEGMSLAEAAQSVQASAFPDAYAQWEDLAYKVIDEVNA